MPAGQDEPAARTPIHAQLLRFRVSNATRTVSRIIGVCSHREIRRTPAGKVYMERRSADQIFEAARRQGAQVLNLKADAIVIVEQLDTDR